MRPHQPADKYDLMLRLATVFDTSGEELRSRSHLGPAVLHDSGVFESAALSAPTFSQAHDDIEAATTGKNGLLTRAVELDADALVLRATVLTYRWIDDLQSAAYNSLGSIAARAIGYLAPEVALGGAIVSAGLIEIDALDRDRVASYLSELAENNPQLMEHVTGGGGLLDGLQMRSLLTVGALARESGPLAARGGLRAIGVEMFAPDPGSALRDTAGGLLGASTPDEVTDPTEGSAPHTLEALMATLATAAPGVSVQRIATNRYIAYLAGPPANTDRRLRLVSGDHSAYAAGVVRAIEATVMSAVDVEGQAHVMLVGSGQGGATAADLAATLTSDVFVIDQVVTTGAPCAQVPHLLASIRVLSLEDRSDPVALLGSLMNSDSANRVMVVFDGQGAAGPSLYAAGGRAADNATHPALQAEITRIRELGYLAS